MKIKINNVYLDDCVNILNKIDSKSVDLVFADPPFNIGIKYDKYQDNKTYNEYLDWSKIWIEESCRILKQNGSVYIAIGDEFSAEINLILKENGLYFRNWIIWYYTFGQNQKKKFNRSHTHILYFTKDKENFIFNADSIRIPSARQLLYNDKRANPKGKIPDDVWQIPRVCGTFHERIGDHPCQMPEELLERIIKVSSNEDDLVVDPFGGTGTTSVVAKRLKRNFITMDISESYYNVIIKRLEENSKVKRKQIVEENNNGVLLFN